MKERNERTNESMNEQTKERKKQQTCTSHSTLGYSRAMRSTTELRGEEARRRPCAEGMCVVCRSDTARRMETQRVERR